MFARKTSILLVLALGVASVFALSLPISNALIKRTSIAPDQDPEFKAVSDLLVSKCADCHSKDIAVYPFYKGFPLADSLIGRNIRNGQDSFLIDRAKLSGKEKFSAEDIQRLSQALAKGNMPPLQYLLLHWDAALSEREQKILSSWIQKRAREFDIRPIPGENFFRPDPRKVELGNLLFKDRRLSMDNSVSCASCHVLEDGGSDHLSLSFGVGGRRCNLNTPTVLNAAYNFSLFWNGRARDLAAQVDAAICDPNEMASSWNQVISKIGSDPIYLREFKQCFGHMPNGRDASDAIAEYERSLLTPGSRFDRFLAGDQNALTGEEKQGYRIFMKSGCASCHAGPALGGLSFEKFGNVHAYYPAEFKASPADSGRFAITGNRVDLYRFKVPTLRNIELTYPYFHDGSAANLEEAVKVMSATQLAEPLSAVDRSKVVAFLRTLTGKMPSRAQ